MKPLSPRQARFVEEFIVDSNATQAAVRAGYSENTARQQASRLLTKVNVQTAVTKLTKARSQRLEFDADTVLQESANLATTSMAAFVDDDGYVVGNLRSLPESALACIRELTQETVVDRDGNTVIRQKIKLYDRLRALELAGRHVGVRAFQEARGSDVAGLESLSARMEEVRARVDAEEREARERGVCVKCKLPLDR